MRDTAIRNTHPNVIIIDAGTEAWDKDGNLVTLDESKITTEIARLQAEYDDLDYSRKREAEYPSLGDQMDMIYKDNKNSTTTHADAVEAVKTKWPKDNSGPV